MNTILPNIIASFLMCLLAYAFPVVRAYAAPSLLLEPSAVSVEQDQTVTLMISIAVDTNPAQSSDAIISYAGSDLEVTAVANGGFFPDVSYANDASGTLEIHGYTTVVPSTITGSGTLARVTFKAKKAEGSSSVSFICTAGTTNTNILTPQGTNILSCPQTNLAGISYIPIPPATTTPTPTPAVGGGNTSPICASMYSDIVSAVGAPLAVTFICTGVDKDGYVNAAEFTFGDGTKELVEKNAGGVGSITTTHTYTTIGALGASCRVRDNNGIYSITPAICKKIITIKPKPPSAGIVQSESQKGTIIEISPPVVEIITETPEASPSPTTASIEEVPAEEEPSRDNRIWWIGGGALMLIFAFLLLRRHKPPAPPETPIPPMNPPTDASMPQTVEV
jgi:hypothetical protein